MMRDNPFRDSNPELVYGPRAEVFMSPDLSEVTVPLWAHAAKLEPKEPWRAIVRELGIAEAAAQAAQRDGILPCTPRAAARFMTL